MAMTTYEIWAYNPPKRIDTYYDEQQAIRKAKQYAVDTPNVSVYAIVDGRRAIIWPEVY